MKETIPAVEGASLEASPQNQESWDNPGEGSELQHLRRRRVQEYHAATLAKEDSLKAVLGSINAGLMQLGIALEQAINEELAISSLMVEQIRHHAPAIEMLLKVTRQIDRFAQLELRPSPKGSLGEIAVPRMPR